MERITVKQLYSDPAAYAGKSITVAGWARTIRSSNVFGFIELNDGSYFKNLQVVLESEKLTNYKETVKQNVGASFVCTGTIELTPNAPQPFEMKAEKVEPVRIMADLIRVICDMQAVFVCRKAGMMQNEIASVTGINPYVLSRYMTAIEGMTAERLSSALAACREADAALKGYAKDYIPIERLICSL